MAHCVEESWGTQAKTYPYSEGGLNVSNQRHGCPLPVHGRHLVALDGARTVSLPSVASEGPSVRYEGAHWSCPQGR
jgi:hypothetical protein